MPKDNDNERTSRVSVSNTETEVTSSEPIVSGPIVNETEDNAEDNDDDA